MLSLSATISNMGLRDYDFSDFGYEGEGIVQMCHCANCGAEIEYRIRLDQDAEDQKT